VVDAIQNYLALVNGLTRMTRQMAMTSARTLLSAAGLEDKANEAGERVSKLAEEILLANRANRELVENLVTAEVDKAAARWGFVRNDDVQALREEVAELRETLARSSAPVSQQPPLGGTPATEQAAPEHPTLVKSEPLPYEPGPIQPQAERARGTDAAAAKTAAKKTAAKKTAAKGTAAAKRTTAKKTAAQQSPAQSERDESTRVESTRVESTPAEAPTESPTA